MDEFKISVNCPSYRRPKVETLDYIPYAQVWVDEGEYEDYIKANPGFEDNIISVPKGIQGNVSRIRNYILDQELKDCDAVLIIDDDLKGIYHHEPRGHFGYEQHLVTPEDLPDMIFQNSVLAKDLGFYFWGVQVNPDNMAYRHATPFSTLSFLGGPFQCFLKGFDLRYDERLPLKEDYDLVIQSINKYRGILRVNKYYYICKQATQAGGCATYRNREREQQQFELFQRKWGSKIVQADKTKGKGSSSKSEKDRVYPDFNPILHIPIKGV